MESGLGSLSHILKPESLLTVVVSTSGHSTVHYDWDSSRSCCLGTVSTHAARGTTYPCPILELHRVRLKTFSLVGSGPRWSSLAYHDACVKVKLMCKVGAAVVAARVAKCNTEPWCRLLKLLCVGLEDLWRWPDYFLAARLPVSPPLDWYDKHALFGKDTRVLFEFDNPFPEYACFDSCTWPDIAGKSEVRAHQMARKLRSSAFTP